MRDKRLVAKGLQWLSGSPGLSTPRNFSSLIGRHKIHFSPKTMCLHFIRAPSSGTATTPFDIVKEVLKEKICNFYTLRKNCLIL